jgi:hypothetical protein
VALEHSDSGDTQSVLYGPDVATSDTLREQRAVARGQTRMLRSWIAPHTLEPSSRR